MISVQTPFGFITTYKGTHTKPFPGGIRLKTSTIDYYVKPEDVTKNSDLIYKYKVIFSAATAEHAGIPDKNGKYRVLSSLSTLEPGEICTQSYFVGGAFDNEIERDNYLSYLKTKFVRFLLQQAITSQHISRDKFIFVPMQDFSKPWTDDELYSEYNLTDEEIAFIDSMIKPMDLNGGE